MRRRNKQLRGFILSGIAMEILIISKDADR